MISIHAPPAGSDLNTIVKRSRTEHFNPRSPCGERQSTLSSFLITPQFQSTLPLRGATGVLSELQGRIVISIHAPPAGSDNNRLRRGGDCNYFNPRSPCGERQKAAAEKIAAHEFQSTLPLRGATCRQLCGCNPLPRFQSTLPLRGATCFLVEINIVPCISIHAPPAGSDNLDYFPTTYRNISIHAPPAGSD